MPLFSRESLWSFPPFLKVSGLLFIISLGFLGMVNGLSQAAQPEGPVQDIAQPDDFDVHAFAIKTRDSMNDTQNWATLMCKFSDVSTEPQGASFFNDMFERTSGPSLKEFWQEVSYNNISDITTDVYGWFTLPHNRAYYGFSEATAGYNVTPIVQDCVDAANATVNFAPYDAVAVMLNSPSPVAITTLFPINYPDGALINLGAITIPSNKYNLALVAHEMGHAYGLPHSFANGNEYQNPWDLMGIASGYRCFVNADPIYSCLGQHTIAAYKEYLGWITPAQKFTAPQGDSTITLERLALPQTTNYRMAVVAGDSETYTIEARQRVGYDAKLAGDAVLIYRGQGDDLIDTNGSPYDDDGAMWLPGETFTDAANDITIHVASATATGFVLNIHNGSTPSQLMKTRLSAAPLAPAANEQVDFEAAMTYEDPGFGSAANVVVTVTFPSELTYVPGSATTSSGTVVNEDPVVVNVASLLSWIPLTIDYAATVNSGVTGPTYIEVPVEISWDNGSVSTSHQFVANGELVYLPVVLK
ncbi:MAG: hypothetical protein H6659_02890 [Ardenticatenaceae bacterium]|nr:hypothetical protein [Ardenticatenaceae bacterium]MCB8986831.1 hypothetical protein [Ardenticatenaceae bacterium]